MKKLFENWREYLSENSSFMFFKKQLEQMGQEIMSQFDIEQDMSAMRAMEQPHGVALFISLVLSGDFSGDFISISGNDVPNSAFNINVMLGAEDDQYKISYQIMEVKPGPQIFHIGQGIYTFELFNDVRDRVVTEIIQTIEEKL